MKIGFDVSQTGRLKAGCGYFADSLIRHLAEIDTENEYILYPTFGDLYWDPDWDAATCRITRPSFRRGLELGTHDAARQFWGGHADDLDQRLGNPDIVHANNFYCPTGLRKSRLVYTLYDISFVEHPEWTTEANRLGCFDGVFNASLHADLIIAISQHTRRHFLETFPHYPPDRVAVVYPASRFTLRSDLARPTSLAQLQPDGFWLSVGTIEPRKNHRNLLEAYARLKTQVDRPLPLVLAGGNGWLMDGFERELDNLGLRDDVIMLGYVDDQSLQWLYQNCFAFVYPSLFEGFGLPVLEAMSLGAAVITSSNTSLPEIVGSGGLLVDPNEVNELASAMLKLVRDASTRLYFRSAALERAKLFSWHRAARSVLDLYVEAVASPRLSKRAVRRDKTATMPLS